MFLQQLGTYRFNEGTFKLIAINSSERVYEFYQEKNLQIGLSYHRTSVREKLSIRKNGDVILTSTSSASAWISLGTCYAEANATSVVLDIK